MCAELCLRERIINSDKLRCSSFPTIVPYIILTEMLSRSIVSLLLLLSLVATATAQFDPMATFADDYAAALTVCDTEKIASFYDGQYTAYEPDGEMYDKRSLMKSVGGFCQTYANATFEILETRRASWDQLYAVMKMKFDHFKTGEIIYAHSFTVMFREGATTIMYDLRGIDATRIKENLK